MQVNTLLEEKLWSVSSENHLDKETYNRIINYLLARLSDYLQTPLELVGDNWMHETAFSADFRGVISPKEAFCITLGGTLGMQLIGDEDKPHVHANLYLFGSGYRLTAGKSNRSFIYMEYNQMNDRNWHSFGWAIDEFDEYENIEEDGFL